MFSLRAMQLLIEMNSLEKQYMELFTGKTIKQKVTYTYNIIPNRDNGNKQIVLFQFSELTGPAKWQLEKEAHLLH